MEIRLSAVSLVHPDGTRALDDVTLHIPPGQFCVVLGPSGAGKSTLLGCLTGMQQPTMGSIMLDGLAPTPRNLRDLRRRTSTIYQQFALVQRASVAANVMAGAVTEMPWWRAMTGLYPQSWRKRAMQAMQAVELEPAHLARRTGALSGGQQQRVAIARAFIRPPALLLADEPVASLDPATAEAVLALIQSQARRHGATVLCSLHQPELARRFADRVIAMRHGRIVYDGAPALFDQPEAMALYHRAPADAAA